MKGLGQIIIGAMLVILAACASRSRFEKTETHFRELPMEARRLTGPLFWLHGDESKDRLEMYVGKVAEGGNGCFTAESRPHNDWLGDGWWRDLKICLEAARKHDLKMWIFDEKWWPSGEVGGKVPPEFGCKMMQAEAISVEGPAAVTGQGYGGKFYIAAVAGREIDDAIDGSSLVDLAPFIRNGNLAWNAPAGKWRVMKFTWKYTGGHRILVDGASRDSVDWYIRTVYQPHYDHFKDDFGKTIVGYFYDEPETPGDWGTEVPKMLADRRIDWKKAYVAWKFKLVGEEQAAAKYQYQDAFAETWGKVMYGGITDWCRDHKVTSIGHWLEHRNEYLAPQLCAGNMFQVQKYSDMGGIDAVFRQFVIGKRVANDATCWQTPKLGSSITHAYGKRDDIAMVEIYGARGQDIDYPEMKWWLDHMQVSGINFIIPHSFNPRAPYDTDCPPYFYNGGFEPRWPLYRVLADYSSRLSLMLTGGRHVCPVALVYLGNSFHVGKTILPDIMSEALQDALYDCDWLPYDVLENDAKVKGRELALRQERYRVLIAPPAEVVPYATMLKIKEFYDAGGVVVAHGFLPTKSATLGRTSADIAAITRAIWGENAQQGLAVCRTNANGGRSYLLPEKPTPRQLQQVLAGDAKIHPTLEVVEGITDNWLHVLHRVKDGRDVFFIVNQNHTGPARKFRFKVTAAGEPEIWDALRNEVYSVEYNRTGDSVLIDLAMEPLESLLLVFNPQRRQLPRRIEGQLAGANSIALVRDSTPVPPSPEPDMTNVAAKSLEGCSWVWYPEGEPARAVPPATRYFRKTITLPPGKKIRAASFLLSADNGFTLFVNGDSIGTSGGWQSPAEMDVAAKLRTGTNALAVLAVNGGSAPNPAGLIGKLRVEFDDGQSMVVPVDTTWRCSDQETQGWKDPAFDDAHWPTAKVAAAFGAGPWGKMAPMVTLSPVKGDPFLSKVELPAIAAGQRVYLEMTDIAPEAAAHVKVNGAFAGGLIGRPLRLEVTGFVRPGANTVEILPFAPREARLVIVGGPESLVGGRPR